MSYTGICVGGPYDKSMCDCEYSEFRAYKPPRFRSADPSFAPVPTGPLALKIGRYRFNFVKEQWDWQGYG